MCTNLKSFNTQNAPIAIPFLKWAGGKRQLLEPILKDIPHFNHYYEPFVGGGAVYFALQPKRATINDLNKELVLAYKVVKDDVESLISLLSKWPNESSFFYRIRSMDRLNNFGDMPPLLHAARLIYLNHTCYNGLYRENKKGFFNTPFGKYQNPKICSEDNLRQASSVLQKSNTEILNMDFADVVLRAKGGDFVYLDPPYDSLKPDSFTAYQGGGFNRTDQIRLKQTVDMLDKKGVSFLLSNTATPFILDLYKEYSIQIITAKRPINSNGKGRGNVEEVLVRNYGQKR